MRQIERKIQEEHNIKNNITQNQQQRKLDENLKLERSMICCLEKTKLEKNASKWTKKI